MLMWLDADLSNPPCSPDKEIPMARGSGGRKLPGSGAVPRQLSQGTTAVPKTITGRGAKAMGTSRVARGNQPGA